MREAVVFLPGLWMPSSAMTLLARTCKKNGYQVFHFRYTATREASDNIVQRLRSFIDQIPASTIHLVGHSYGGLLAIKALEDGHARVVRIVCLGSPLLGSRAASGLAKYRWGRFVLGESLSLLGVPQLSLCSPQTEVGVIAGSMGAGLGRFFGDFEGPHDGAVLVAETRAPWVKDHIVLPVAHSQMLLSGNVAASTVQFLQVGSFQ